MGSCLCSCLVPSGPWEQRRTSSKPCSKQQQPPRSLTMESLNSAPVASTHCYEISSEQVTSHQYSLLYHSVVGIIPPGSALSTLLSPIDGLASLSRARTRLSLWRAASRSPSTELIFLLYPLKIFGIEVCELILLLGLKHSLNLHQLPPKLS